MHSGTKWYGLVGLVAVVAIGCGDDSTDTSTAAATTPDTTVTTPDTAVEGDTGGMEMKVAEPSADTKALYAAIQGYDKWPKFDEMKERVFSESHMKMWVMSYFNDVVGKAIQDGTVPLPEGAIIVKENYAGKDDAMPMALTVMHKKDGDWYWLEGTPDGKVILGDDGTAFEGKDVKMCTMCHNKNDGNDGVFVHTFKKDMPMPKTAEPSADTKALYAAIQGYDKWPKFAELQEKTKSASHMNMWVIAYYNDVVGKAIADKTVPLAEGAIIVKENYAQKDDAMPMALTVMHKKDGAWYWLEGTPDGKVILGDDGKAFEGKDVPMCSGCHKSDDGNDGVLVHQFK